MYDIPGFDPKTLSDDELFSKQVALTQRKAQVSRAGRADIVSQLDVMIRAIDHERRERMFLERHKSAPASPVVVETDPDMREDQKAAEEKAAAKPSQPDRPLRRALRTPKPVIPND